MKTVRLTLCQYILAQGDKGCTVAAEKEIHEMRKTPSFVVNHTPAPDLASVMHGFVRCAP